LQYLGVFDKVRHLQQDGILHLQYGALKRGRKSKKIKLFSLDSYTLVLMDGS